MHDVPPRKLGKPALGAGFTLIELSVVLTIIGLIVGGVLVGQYLVKAAQIRKDIATIQGLTTAVFAFRDKYVCLPGDCANASNFFGASVPNGNGDAIINGVNGDCGGGGCDWDWHSFGPDGVREESSLFYIHLTNAGLVSLGAFTYSLSLTQIGPSVTWVGLNSPTGGTSASPNGGICPIAWQGVNYYWLSCTQKWAGNAAIDNIGGYSTAVAYAIDSKIDDGLPYMLAII
jgi:prepilin-type N-terminal cleavage/methylation domain-containing protein